MRINLGLLVLDPLLVSRRQRASVVCSFVESEKVYTVRYGRFQFSLFCQTHVYRANNDALFYPLRLGRHHDNLPISIVFH